MNPNRCPVAKKCGGCQLQNLSYARQLQHKQVKVIRLLGRFHHVSEIIGMEYPYHYRHKVQAAFGVQRGKTVSGIYQSSTHTIVPVESCQIEDLTADAIVNTVRKLAVSFKLRPFDDTAMRGFLRHVMIRKGYATGQFLVVLVTGRWEFPDAEKFVRALLSRHPEITTVVQNLNDRRTSLVLGEKSRILYGPGYIEDCLGGLRFRLSPKAFYQVNPQQTEVLYRTALDFAGLDGSQTVLDAYCGTGTIGLLAASRAKKVIGVELNEDAVADARENAARNGIDNAVFYQADAGDFMLEAAESGLPIDLVILDPPRAGASPAFLRALTALMPPTVVYISCNPETQARDLAVLARKGYKVRRIQPVDMFPHTDHVETVVLLSRETNPLTVEVRMEVETGEVKEHPTYKRIQEYVQEKYGFKVHTAYIAEVKRMVGLDMHKAPNAVEQRKHEYHPCPPEKVEAIKDALRHFGLISE